MERLVEIARQYFDAAHPNAFYGSADALSLGAGLLYSGVSFATYDSNERQFVIVDGLVLVLTHECDTANDREFNDYVLIAPVIDFTSFCETFVNIHGFSHTANIVHLIAKNSVYRVAYLPPGPGGIKSGGLIYLNQITNAHVSLFDREGVSKVGALSRYALERFDMKLKQHLFRPKDEQLPVTV